MSETLPNPEVTGEISREEAKKVGEKVIDAVKQFNDYEDHMWEQVDKGVYNAEDAKAAIDRRKKFYEAKHPDFNEQLAAAEQDRMAVATEIDERKYNEWQRKNDAELSEADRLEAEKNLRFYEQLDKISAQNDALKAQNAEILARLAAMEKMLAASQEKTDILPEVEKIETDDKTVDIYDLDDFRNKTEENAEGQAKETNEKEGEEIEEATAEVADEIAEDIKIDEAAAAAVAAAAAAEALNETVNSDAGAGETENNNREERVAAVLENSKNKPAVRKSLKKWGVKALAIALAVAIAVGAGGLLGKKGNKATEPEPTAVTVEMNEGIDDTRYEHINGTKYDYTKDYLNPNKHRFADGTLSNRFGMDKSEFYNDKAGTIDSIIEICKNQPETLASHVSFFPSILKECGVEGKTAFELDEMLSNKENGGELQDKLLKAYEAKLRDEATNYTWYHEDDSEQSFYMYCLDGTTKDDDLNPSQIGLNMILSSRDNAAQVRIVNGSESIDLNMPCGYQPNIDTSAPDEEKQEVEEATPEKAPSVTPEVGPVEEPTPIVVPVTPETPVTPVTPVTPGTTVVPKTENTNAGPGQQQLGTTPEQPATGYTPITRVDEIARGDYVEDTANVAPGEQVNTANSAIYEGEMPTNGSEQTTETTYSEDTSAWREGAPSDVPVVGGGETVELPEARPNVNPESAAGNTNYGDQGLANIFAQMNNNGGNQ